MKKKLTKELKSVVTFNEALIKNVNGEIIDALAISSNDDLFYNDLNPQMKLIENNNEDIEYLLNNVSEKCDAVDYVLARRDMLYSAYDNFLTEQITFLANTIYFTITNTLPNIYLDMYNIQNILKKPFDRDLKEFMIYGEVHENSLDLTMINNVIPQACLELNTLLRSRFHTPYNITKINAPVDEPYDEYVSPRILNLKEFKNNYAAIDIVIEKITNAVSFSLIDIYWKIKSYVNGTLVPLGYPEIAISPELVDERRPEGCDSTIPKVIEF